MKTKEKKVHIFLLQSDGKYNHYEKTITLYFIYRILHSPTSTTRHFKRYKRCKSKSFNQLQFHQFCSFVTYFYEIKS